MDKEEEGKRSMRQYHYVTVILFASLLVFLIAQNILAVKLVLMGTVCVKAYGFIYKEIKYEFYSCIIYMMLLAYLLFYQ